MKNILIIDGHPHDESFCKSLADSYEKTARLSKCQVHRINLRELKFDLNLRSGYSQIQDLEPDLLNAQEAIKKCDHLTLVYPVWWGSMPALLKGFFDRTLLPGFAFKYHDQDPYWDKLLAGRSARIIISSDAPSIYNLIAYHNAPYVTVKKCIFSFCGFKPVKVTKIGGVKYMSAAKRIQALEKVARLPSKDL